MDKKKLLLTFTLYLCLLTFPFYLSGCIRFNAGVWHQGQDDEYPKGKSVGFDTANLNPNYAPGNIQMDEE